MENGMNEVIEMQAPDNRLSAPRNTAVATTPSDLLRLAVEGGADLDRLERLMALQTQWEANEARKAYVADMAEFKKAPPEITKDKIVGYKNKDGSVTGYMHATIGNVTNKIVAALAMRGFSHRWDLEQQSGGLIVVTCVLTHKLGHSERTMLSSTRDDSGKKNNIQQMASTITYLERYTLLAACGVATKDQGDDDGESAESEKEEPTRALPIIAGKAFDRAIASVRGGDYTATEIRKYYALTDDQETALSDVEKEKA
jgi:hypothetical protein